MKDRKHDGGGDLFMSLWKEMEGNKNRCVPGALLQQQMLFAKKEKNIIYKNWIK